MCRALGLDVTEFYVKRNALSDTPQLKADSATLRDLGLVDGSILHVALGTPLTEDEYALKVCLMAANRTTIFLCEVRHRQGVCRCRCASV